MLEISDNLQEAIVKVLGIDDIRNVSESQLRVIGFSSKKHTTGKDTYREICKNGEMFAKYKIY